MSLQRQILFWLGAFLVFVLLLYIFSAILLPFVAGMAIAYFLDPVADRLERLGFSRLAATTLIVVLFLLVFVGFVIIVVPILGGQLIELVNKLPGYLEQLQTFITLRGRELLAGYVDLDSGEMPPFLKDMVGKIAGWAGTVVGSLWSGGVAIISFLSLFVVTPVVAFYMLYDWDRMVAKVDSWLPRDHVHTIRAIFADIDTAIAGFVRGQGTVCLLLGGFYATALTIAGLDFGLLIGLFAGLVSFIPYVGSTLGLILSVGVALVQFWPDWIMIAAIAAIFFAGQFFEGNILSPKLVGDSVGLHPVWLMFALFAFGYLFGFVGMLIAVPMAAAIGVLVRFALMQYQKSRLFAGAPPPAPRPRRPSGGQ